MRSAGDTISERHLCAPIHLQAGALVAIHHLWAALPAWERLHHPDALQPGAGMRGAGQQALRKRAACSEVPRAQLDLLRAGGVPASVMHAQHRALPALHRRSAGSKVPAAYRARRQGLGGCANCHRSAWGARSLTNLQLRFLGGKLNTEHCTCQYSGLPSILLHLRHTPDSLQRSFVPADS